MSAAERPLADAVRRGVRLFNRGRYLAAQGIWEEAWREAPGEVRGFLEGLVQLAGGLHLRTRRGATRGAVQLLAQSLIALEDHRPAQIGVDVDALLADFAAYLDWLREIDRPHRLLDGLRVPRLRLA
jgi:predicted metal-dependent hydrolase